jgi:transcriptional regulator with XRE-family HTH domain
VKSKAGKRGVYMSRNDSSIVQSQEEQELSKDYLKYNIGDKFKNVRLSKKLTQRHVARMTGLSPALISLIESDNICASIATLSKLTCFYGITMDSLFDDKVEIKKFDIVRKDERKIVSRVMTHLDGEDGYYLQRLSSTMNKKKMEPFLITLSDGISGDTTFVHDDETYLFVLDGTLEIMLENQQLLLEEGDGVYLDALLEHRLRSKPASQASVLLMKKIAI